MNEHIIKELLLVLNERKKQSEKISYTSYLIKNPEFLAKKIGEESSELIVDFIKKKVERRRCREMTHTPLLLYKNVKFIHTINLLNLQGRVFNMMRSI